MNLRQTIEVAALISANSSHVVEHDASLPADALQRFWSCSKTRVNRWLTHINEGVRHAALAAPARRSELWHDIGQVIEEIYAAEALARIWGAILTARDRYRREQETEPLARNVLVTHLAARQRALTLMLNSQEACAEDLARLDRSRRCIERWTDVLLGHLVRQYGADDFAFEPERALDFGDEQLSHGAGPRCDQYWELLMLGLRTAFPVSSRRHFSQAVLQTDIVRSILACFPEEAFDRRGFKANWLRRICLGSRQPEGPLPAGRDI